MPKREGVRADPALPRLKQPSARMAKLDCFEWAAGLSFVAYGVSVGVRVNDPRALGRLHRHLPLGWRPSPSLTVELLYSLIVGGCGRERGLRRPNLLYAGAARLARTMDSDELYDKVESNLKLSVAEHARGRLFVHAGVVGWRGRAIVIPGRSWSGKSTLVQALVRLGASYYSDEYAVLDARGRVHPYPQPLSIRQGPDQRPRRYPVEALGGGPGRKPLPVGLVIVTQYRSQACWRPRELSPAHAMLALFANTVPARSRPDVALPTLRRALDGATTLKGQRAEASALAPLLLDQLGEQSPPMGVAGPARRRGGGAGYPREYRSA
jgi:hypothetical protein